MGGGGRGGGGLGGGGGEATTTGDGGGEGGGGGRGGGDGGGGGLAAVDRTTLPLYKPLTVGPFTALWSRNRQRLGCPLTFLLRQAHVGRGGEAGRCTCKEWHKQAPALQLV